MSAHRFIGSLLCLDFVNTQPMQDGVRVDLLGDFADLVRWLVDAGALEEASARRALARWNGRAAGAAVMAEARALRAALAGAAERLAAARPARALVGGGGEPCACVAAGVPAAGGGGRSVREPPGAGARVGAPASRTGGRVRGVAPGAWGARAGAAVRGTRLRALLLRHDQEPQPAVVQHGGVREPGQGGRLLPASTAGGAFVRVEGRGSRVQGRGSTRWGSYSTAGQFFSRGELQVLSRLDARPSTLDVLNAPPALLPAAEGSGAARTRSPAPRWAPPGGPVH